MNTVVLKILDNNPSETSEFFNLGETYADVSYRLVTFKRGGRGHLADYYNSSQSFITTFSYSLVQKLWELEF